ncbi:hypothetical protein [Streptomyces sp. TLI_105]|uniref:hypothetical protein n=1 Tax=Streptomyces sp. TLI_105 TaxID=1881019 RepID=UPI0008981BDA|nr:hypothetical protein [Streptomyces sp. TLI_105]SEB56987.1 hypothetical protein SAMN05428939_0016 [Streptomyces sp. TLI_105]
MTTLLVAAPDTAVVMLRRCKDSLDIRLTMAFALQEVSGAGSRPQLPILYFNAQGDALAAGVLVGDAAVQDPAHGRVRGAARPNG